MNLLNIFETKYQNQVGLFSTYITNVHYAAPLPLSYMVYWLPRELYNDLFKTPCNCISLRSTVKWVEILLWFERAFLFSFIYAGCTIAIIMNSIGISYETAGFCIKSKILFHTKCQPIVQSLVVPHMKIQHAPLTTTGCLTSVSYLFFKVHVF